MVCVVSGHWKARCTLDIEYYQVQPLLAVHAVQTSASGDLSKYDKVEIAADSQENDSFVHYGP